VDDDCADRAFPCRRRILVIPSTVVEPGVASEQLGVPIWIVVHDQEDLAAQVLVLEIVPRIFGCIDSITDKDDFRVLDFGNRALYAARCDELIPVVECERLRTAIKRPSLRHFGSDADDVELLHPASVGAARLQTDRVELIREILLGAQIPSRGRPPALVFIAREFLDVTGQSRRRDPADSGLAFLRKRTRIRRV